MIPSVKTLVRDLKLTKEKAELVRFILGGWDYAGIPSLEWWQFLHQTFPKEKKLLDSNYFDYEKKMELVNIVLNGYGVGYIERGSNFRSPALYYVNMGDTYRTTIVRTGRNNYRVTSWGDIVERGNYA